MTRTGKKWLALAALGSAAYYLFFGAKSADAKVPITSPLGPYAPPGSPITAPPAGGGFVSPVSPPAANDDNIFYGGGPGSGPAAPPPAPATPAIPFSKPPLPFAGSRWIPQFGDTVEIRTPNTFAKNAKGESTLTKFTVVSLTALRGDDDFEGRALFYIFPDGSRVPAPPNTPFVHFSLKTVEDFIKGPIPSLGGGGTGT